MRLDDALSLVPVVLEEVRALRREVGELLARADEAGVRWVSPSEWARLNGCSVDTVTRRVATGEIESREIGRSPLGGADGQQLTDREGRPRYRRTLRLRLTRPATAGEVRSVAVEMIGTASPGSGSRGRSRAVTRAGDTVGTPWPAEPAEAHR
ncbi:MAG TPA: hypothetical protein VMT03_02070 [Polyangia bacterium]|nr:hypothetical protein [Polyangia bacterium]